MKTEGSIFSEHGDGKERAGTPANRSTTSKPYSGPHKEHHQISVKKKKNLDEIQEVYEEFNGFLAHTKMAFISFFSLLFFVLKMAISFLFFKIIFPVVEKILWLIFILLVLICTILAFVGNLIAKLVSKKKKLNPFHDQNKLQRIKKFDKIFEIKKFTIVLDLDNTLIHASKAKKDKLPKGIHYEKISMNVLGKGKQSIHLYIRPFLEEFLSKLGEKFNLAIFSASEECYCDAIVDHIDKWGVIQRRFYKNSVTIEQKIVKKDLTKIIKGSLENVIMIEDAPGTCIQKDNAIVINRWLAENPRDNELKILLESLLEVVEDVEKGGDLINFYRQKLEEEKKKDVQLDIPDDREESLVQETDGGLTSPNYESTFREDTEVSREENMSQSYMEDPPIAIILPTMSKQKTS